MRARNARPRESRAWLLLAIGISFTPPAHAGVSVWTSSGPYGGYVRTLAVDPKTPTTLYAGTSGEGVFKSTDSGSTWSLANTGLTNLFIYALAIDPSTPETLYAGTNHGEVFKSTDAGRTWAVGNNGLPSSDPVFPEILALIINPKTPSTLYAGTRYGVFRSTDAGETWSTASTGLVGHLNCLAIDPLTPATLYAGTDQGVFKTQDGGGTWTDANVGLTNLYVFALAINPVTPATLYAANLGGIFRSTDSGGTWRAANTGFTNSIVKTLLIDPSTPSTLYAGTTPMGLALKGEGVFKSNDSGSTWVPRNTNLTNPTIAALAINPSAPATLYAGTFGGGIFRSADAGATWAVANSGMDSLSISAIAIDPANPATVYAGTRGFGGYGFFKSIDAGRTWAVTTPGQPYPNITCLAIDPAAPSTIYAGTEGGGVFKSTDAGATWADASVGLTNKWVSVLEVDPSNPSILYAGTYLYDGATVFKSTDAGASWEAADTGLTNLSVRALVINPSVHSTIYAATDSGIFKSTDSGGSWTAVGSTIRYVNALAIDPSTPATLYAGTSSGIFKSTDSGANWTEAGLTSKSVAALAINPSKPATLYAGTYGGGVFRSTDSGGRWSAINAGLPSPTYQVEVLALDPTGATTLYAGLLVGGLWQWTPPAEPAGFSGFVPIVLDVVGLARYTSELQLTNLGASPVTVNLSYTSSIGSGTGHIAETLPPGQQVVYPDAVSYLRTRGVPIPTSGNQGGTLLLSAPGPAPGVHATVRTGADTVAPQPVGRAGLAYTADDPASSLATRNYVYGLRTNDADRSNLAVYNMGAEPVSLRVTLVSGDDGSSFEVTAGAPLVLPAWGWYQYGDGSLLRAAGLSSGYAIIDWVSGSGPFGAYGVVNDQKTNDGSFVPALPGTPSGTRLTLPVLVETGNFDSELILTNRGRATATFTLRYLESLSPAKGLGGTMTVEVAAGRQKIIPQAIDFLRSKGLSIGARGEASYAGSLRIQVSGVALEDVFAGARTSSPSPAGGEYGLFYPAVDSSQEFSDTAFILGLKADMNNRSNVAIVHTGEDGSGPIRLELQVMDGSEGGRPAGQPLSVELDSGQWAQPARFFAGRNIPNGYVRIRRTDGRAPWYAYGVIHDGSQPGQRTGDGSYVPGVR